jgi:hypothetical protein
MIQQQQSKLIPYLLILLGFAGGWYYYSQAGSNFAVAPIPQEGRDDLRVFKNLRIDFAMLESPQYKHLRLYGEFPISKGVAGKTDPFAK